MNGDTKDTVVFEMSRAFDAPLDKVWAAWTEAASLKKWWGPKGCTLEVLRLEFRPAGFFHYSMTFPGAPTMWGRFNYREIDTGKRLVWLNSFANEWCGIERAPFSAECPMEIENTVTFTGRDGKTIVDLRAKPFGAKPAETMFFANLKPSLEMGYGGTMEQLKDFLSV